MNNTINSTSTNKLKNNIDSSTKKISSLKKLMNFGAVYIGMRKGWSFLKDVTTANIDMIETNNLFEVSMGKVVDQYGNLDIEASKYYTKAMNLQNEMNEKLATNKAELMEYQSMYYSMLKSQGINKDASYLMSESLTKAGYDIASLYNLSVEDAMDKLKSGLAGQVEPLRKIGVDISESSLSKVLNNVGIERSVQQLSYAEKEVARYIAIIEQAGQAQGDFAKTFEQPANQIKVFQNQLQELKQVAGSFITNVFGNILVYVNAIIMVIKEILKALASLFGYNLDTGGANLNTAVGAEDLNQSLGSAGKKAKELKKQLMGFDEINNIDPATQSGGGSGGVATGVNDKLLKALKEWDNQMSNISGKAQEIRDKMLEWLGFTKDTNGNLKWSWENMNKIAKIVTVIIGIIAGITLIGKLTKLVKGLKNLFTILKTGKGAVTTFGLGLQTLSKVFKALGTVVSGVTTGIKLGIEQFILYRKAGNSVLTSLTKTGSAMVSLIPKVVKVGGGIAGIAGSSVLAYKSMEDLSNGSIGTGEAVGKLSLSLAGATASGALLGSVIPGVGTAIGALGGFVIGATSALFGYNNEVDEYQQKLEETNQRLAEQHTAMETYISDLQKQREEIENIASFKLAEIEDSQKLVDELKKITDENGKIKAGYEDRALFITSQLKEAYGVEASIVNGVIKNYDDYINKIQEAINNKKAEILLKANEEKYTIAIQNQAKAYDEYQKSLKETTAIYNEMKEKQELLNKSQSVINEIMKKNSREWSDWEIKAVDAYNHVQAELLDLNEQFKVSAETTKGYKDTFKQCTDDIIEYEDLYTATIKGDTEEINKQIEKQTHTYETESGKQIQSLENQVKMEQDIAKIKKENYQQLGKDITNITGDTNEAMLQNLKENLVEQTKSINDLTPDILNSWETLAKSSYEDYTDAISKLPEEVGNTITSMSATVRRKMTFETPVTREVFGNSAKEFKGAFDANLNGESSGRDYVNGVNRGINSNSSILRNTITNLASNTANWFKNTLQIHSPSRLMASIAEYIPAGIAKGIDDNADTVYSSMKELSNGIEVNAKDMAIDTNQYVDYGAINGQVKTQTNVAINGNIIQEIAESVKEAIQNAELNVNIEAKTEEGVIVKKASQGIKDYVMQTGELPFPVPI